MSDRLHSVGRAVCDRRGYDVTTPEKPWLPSAVAEPTVDADPFVSRATSEPVAIEPLAPEEVTPTMLLSRLRNNRRHDRFSLFVVDQAAAETARDILVDPPLVAAEDDYGRRAFYNGPDRIHLADGGYAAVRTDTPPENLVWREDGDGDERSLLLVDAGRDADAACAAEGFDDPQEARISEAVLAWLDDVDSLSCPPASQFPYSYRRSSADKRFRIRRPDGDVVGVYNGVSAMRANAYVPVPMPLVPEHVFAGVDSVRDEWAIVVAGGEEHSAVDADVAFQLVTADTPRRE
jgi:hypothetical protein